MKLQGKTALVTGASSGIGKSFAYLLASKGMNLVLVARSLDKLEAIGKDIESKHQVVVKAYKQDLSLPNAAKALYEQVKEGNQGIDLLINNAGFGKWGAFNEFSMEDYQSMIHLNVTSLTELCYLFLPDLRKKSEAGIINVGSTASLLPVPFSSVYGATKSFVLYFTEGLVGELSDTNVKVSCLCPAATATNFNHVASNATVANDDSMKSPDAVAKEGLDGFLAGKHYTVTGRKSVILLTRLLSRKRVLMMVAAAWKKRIASN